MTGILLTLLLAGSFGLGLICTPVARRLALRCGLVDQPDGLRKIHDQSVPLAGGLAVFLSAGGALAVAAAASTALRECLVEHGVVLSALLLACGVICVVGLLDDFHSLRGRHKLFGQLLAVSIVMGSGLVVNQVRLFGWHFELGVLALPFTAFWLLGAINSLNLIDGMDGLLGCVGTIITLALAAMALVSGQWATAAVAVALAGALLAFLCFNFPPASIFLGDCGSMLVGLVVGVLAIHSSLKAPTAVALAAPAALLTIPIFDTLAAIVRRKLTGRSIYASDRGHIHHCLLRSGLSTRRALLLVSVLCLLTVVGVGASLVLNSELLALIAAVTVVAILISSRLFGYAEFVLLKERLGALWAAERSDQSSPVAHQLAVRLQGSAQWQELWASLTSRAAQWNLRSLCLDVNIPALHEGYHARWDRLNGAGDGTPAWRAEVPLVLFDRPMGRLEVTGDRDLEVMAGRLALVAQLAAEIELEIARLTAAPATRVDGAVAASGDPAVETVRVVLPPNPETPANPERTVAASD